VRDERTTAPLTTATVAAAAGCSAQQVRDLEALGVIPAAPRSPQGYRQFTAEHVDGLRAYRDLAFAVGPVEARRAMREIRLRPPDRAVALISGFHVRLDDERKQALLARSALESVRAESAVDARPLDGDAMTITELSRALGVRASTLRFWEQAGLVTPERVATRAGTARRYPVPAVREARITAALRAGGYPVRDVRRAIVAVRNLDDVSDSLAALDDRLQTIARRTVVLLRAGTMLASIIESPRPS
jgi:DNA-binding transcriptional MerR regulator